MIIKEVGLRLPPTWGECPGWLETNPEARPEVPGAAPGSIGLTNAFETEAKSGLFLT